MSAKNILLDPVNQRRRWDEHWRARLDEARAYHDRHDCYPQRGESPLGTFLSDCQQAFERLYPERTTRMAALEALPGWTWDSPERERWLGYIGRASDWYEVHGPVDPTTKSDDRAEVRLSKWIYAQRLRYKATPQRLSVRDLETLEAVPHWSWVAHNPILSRKSFLERELGWMLSNVVPVPVRAGSIRTPEASFDCDIVIAGLRAIVEVDGAWAHRDRAEQDAMKTGALQADGWAVVRVREAPLSPLGDASVSFTTGEATTAIAQRVVVALREATGAQVADIPDAVSAFTVNSTGRRGWRDTWYQRYEDLLETLRSAPLNDVIVGHRTREGIDIGTWISTQRRRCRQGRLSSEQVRLLERIDGWDWQPKSVGTNWEDGLARLKEHVALNGCLPTLRHVCADGMTLGSWMHAKRRRYRQGTISIEWQQALEAVPHWRWAGAQSGVTGEACPAAEPASSLTEA